jgi:hypothetical protein
MWVRIARPQKQQLDNQHQTNHCQFECSTHGVQQRPNSRPEWRGAKGLEMQTGRVIPRPLQAVGSAAFVQCSRSSVLSQDAK